jgi:hypothetical protein
MPEVTLELESRKFVASTRALGARRNRESSRYTYLVDLVLLFNSYIFVLCTGSSHLG